MYTYRVKEIVKIYDGDTIQVILDLGFGIYKHETIRLLGIDTPELRGDEYESGIISRDYLRERLYLAYEMNKEIFIKTTKDKQGKYGRYLGVVFVEETDINEELLSLGLAEVYK